MNQKQRVNLNCSVPIEVGRAVEEYAQAQQVSLLSITREALMRHLESLGIWPPKTSEPAPATTKSVGATERPSSS